MRAVVTSLVRRAGLAEPSGYVSVVDLESGRLLARAPVPESLHRASDPNPRGGLRGAKGVSALGDRLVVANTERLFVLGPGWTIERELTHPWLGGIHDVLADPDGIWVTSSACDLLARIGWNGDLAETWTWRNDSSLAEEIGLPGTPLFDGSLDHRDPLTAHTGFHNLVHLNAVARTADGLVVSLGRIASTRTARRRERRAAFVRTAARTGAGGVAVGAVRTLRGAVQWSRRTTTDRLGGSTAALVLLPDGGGRAEILYRTTGVEIPNHNVLAENGLLLYNDSALASFVAVDSRNGEISVRVPVPGSPPFPRGLARLADDVFLVGGQAPAAVHVIDLSVGRVTRSLELGGVANESVYAIALVPDTFADPAGRLLVPGEASAP